VYHPVPIETTQLTGTRSSPNVDTLRRVRVLLADSGYNEDGIRSAGVDPGFGVRRGDVPILRRALQGVEPLSTLVRLLLFGDTLDAADVERRLLDGARLLGDAGLVERRGASIVPLASVTPWRELLVVHDPDPDGELWPSHVAGPTPAADALASLIVTRRAHRALDLGTGSGLLAALIARDADAVVATDVNPAALRFAAMTAALSGRDNVDIREGSLFEPVENERFGLIVSNPPFVISPESELVFRHSVMSRDDLSAAVVRGAAAHLGDDGFAILGVNWIQGANRGWLDVPRSWLEGSDCDAIVLRLAVEEPLSYATRWNLRRQQLDPQAFADAIDSWLDYYASERIDAIASGVVVLHRRAAGGRHIVHGLELAGETRGSAGDHLVAIFDALEYLGREPARDELLATPFAMPSNHRLEQSLRSSGENYVVESTTLSLDEGLGVRLAVDPDLVPILLRLDGTQPLGEAASEVAQITGGDVDDLADRSIAFVRDLLTRGMAVPR
jgi:methylase of polypeptide subunit release factors